MILMGISVYFGCLSNKAYFYFCSANHPQWLFQSVLTYLSFTVALEIEVIQDFQDSFILLE